METQSTTAAFYSQFQHQAQLRLRRGDQGGDGGSLSLRDRLRQRGSPEASGRIADRTQQPTETRPTATEPSVRTAVREAIAYERAERGTLKLRTQEGDIVRLKFMASDSISMQGQKQADGDNVFGEFSLEASSNTRFKIAVKGDLNPEEQKAIEDVLAQAGELAASFYGGDVADAFALASDFQIDSEQLARVNLRFSVQERFSYARQTVSSQAQQAPALEPAPASQPLQAPTVGSVPSSPTVQPPVVTSGPVLTNPATPSAQVSLTGATGVAQVNDSAQIAPATAAAVTPPSAEPAPAAADDLLAAVDHLASALSTIMGFLTQLTESLESLTGQLEAQADQAAFSFSFGFKLQLVGAFIGSMAAQESDEGPMHNHELAAATIDELAAQSDARLDDVA